MITPAEMLISIALFGAAAFASLFDNRWGNTFIAAVMAAATVFYALRGQLFVALVTSLAFFLSFLILFKGPDAANTRR